MTLRELLNEASHTLFSLDYELRMPDDLPIVDAEVDCVRKVITLSDMNGD